MTHALKLFTLAVLLISFLSAFEADNVRKNKLKLSSWITPLKIGLIGGLLYGTKQMRPVYYFADSGSYLSPMIYQESYDRYPYAYMQQPLNVPDTPMSQFPYMDHRACSYGKGNRCRDFRPHGGNAFNTGWKLPRNIRQEPIPVYLNTPITQQVEQDTKMSFNPGNTGSQSNTGDSNIHVRENIRNFNPRPQSSYRKTRPFFNSDRNISNPLFNTSVVNIIPNTSDTTEEGQNASTVLTVANVQRPDPQMHLTKIFTKIGMDSSHRFVRII